MTNYKMKFIFSYFLPMVFVLLLMSAFIYNDRKQNIKQVHKIYTNLEEALKNKDSVFILSLSGGNMKIVPNGIYELKNLKKLFLNDNNITSINNKISNLKNLEELILFHNHLRDLPIEIRELKRLKRLDLYGNNFEFIPEAVCGLDSLEVLNMLGSSIKKYPDCIFNLKNIKRLYIQNWDGKYEIDSVQLMRLRKGLPKTHIGILPPYITLQDSLK